MQRPYTYHLGLLLVNINRAYPAQPDNEGEKSLIKRATSLKTIKLK